VTWLAVSGDQFQRLFCRQDVGHTNGSARLRERCRHGLAQAARTTGDERDLAIQPEQITSCGCAQ
jgi:hypothetical protein